MSLCICAYLSFCYYQLSNRYQWLSLQTPTEIKSFMGELFLLFGKKQKFETSKFQSIFVQLYVWIRCPTDFGTLFLLAQKAFIKIACLFGIDMIIIICGSFLVLFWLEWDFSREFCLLIYNNVSLHTPFSWVGGIQF
jgi:hypothetical protein